MMESIRTWLAAVVAASVLVSVVQAVIPAGAIRKISSMTGGLLLLIVIVQPLLGVNLEKLNLRYEEYAAEIGERQAKLQSDSQEELSGLIEEKTEAYIQKKAQSLGLTCSVKVGTEEDENGISQPVSVCLSCARNEKLAEYLSGELGIPEERQVWNGKTD